ncbi:hypothetical protein [Streptomyces sp. MAR4 CNX-425]|uniref:hypothetical protein n=1 Tax=Streptomyces sp. MAR4 CNX-425 TaxID=3406343 RepID=UPI003B507838
MTRPRRGWGGATRARPRVRVLGCVLALVGLLAGAVACADGGGGGDAPGHALVLRADGPRADILDGLDGLRAAGARSEARPAADAGDTGDAADAPDASGAPDSAPRSAVPLPVNCSTAHTPDAPVGDCPAASERATATPLFGPGPGPAPASPAHAAQPAGAVDGGVGPPAPSAVGSPCLHELQVQRT